MKKVAFAFAIAALFTVGAGFAGARPEAKHAVTPVTVVMHDPGCHWFSVGGKLKTKLVVAGPARLLNVDEAALKVVGAGAVRRVGVGRTLTLGTGSYAITMIGQAADDNHLKLVVR